MKWIGRRQSVGIAKEATRGVNVQPTFFLNVNSFDFFDVVQKARSETSFGRITGGAIAPVSLRHAEGDMEVELGSESFGLILLALLGTVSSTGPADAVAYTHSYSLQNDNAHDSLTIHTIDPIGQFAFELGMINSLTLNITPDGIVTYTVNFMSKTAVDSGGVTASYTAENKFIGRNLAFKIAATTASLTAASNIKLKSLTLNFEKNTEVNQVMSTIQPDDIVNKLFSITGSVELDYEDRTYIDYMKDGSYKAVRIELEATSVLTGAATTKAKFTLDLSKVDFENFSPDVSMNDIVKQSFDITALYDVGGNDNLINACTLVNLTANY